MFRTKMSSFLSGFRPMLRAMQKECHVFFLIRSHMINTNHPQKDLLFYEFKNKDHRSGKICLMSEIKY